MTDTITTEARTKQPFVKVNIRTSHNKLCFRDFGIFQYSGEGLKQYVSKDGLLELVEISPKDVRVPTDGSALGLYIGNPNGTADAQGSFALRIGAHNDGIPPDAETYVGIAYDIPVDGTPRYYMALTETEPGFDMTMYRQPLQRAYIGNWQYQLKDSSVPLRQTYTTMGQDFIIKADLGQCEDYAEINVEIAEPQKGDEVHRKKIYLAATPLPRLSQALRNEKTSFGEDTNKIDLKANDDDQLTLDQLLDVDSKIISDSDKEPDSEPEPQTEPEPKTEPPGTRLYSFLDDKLKPFIQRTIQAIKAQDYDMTDLPENIQTENEVILPENMQNDNEVNLPESRDISNDDTPPKSNEATLEAETCETKPVIVDESAKQDTHASNPVIPSNVTPEHQESSVPKIIDAPKQPSNSPKKDEYDNIIINIRVDHPDIILCEPSEHILSGKRKNEHTSSGEVDKLKDVAFNMPTTICCVSEKVIKSRGLFLYEIRTRQAYQQKNEVRSRKDIMYLAISWQLKMDKDMPQDERCLFSVLILRTNHPSITRAFVLQRLFDKMMELTLAQEIEKWYYALPDGVLFTLHSDMKSDSLLNFDPNDKDMTFEPVKVDICIDSLGSNHTDHTLGPALFLPAYGYHWRTLDAMEELNKQLKQLEKWNQEDIYLLVDNTRASPCRLEYIYDIFKGKTRIVNKKILDTTDFDLYRCLIDSNDSMFRVVYAIDTGDTILGQQAFLVVGCDQSKVQATIIQTWNYVDHTTADPADMIQFLDETCVEAKYLPGTLVESGYGMPDGTLIRLEQFRSFGKPNVATVAVERCLSLDQITLGQSTPLHLRIYLKLKLESIKFQSIGTIATGWQQQRKIRPSFSELDNFYTLDFHYTPVPDGQGRALCIYFHIENATQPGCLKSIELSTRSFTENNVASMMAQVNMECTPNSTAKRIEVIGDHIDPAHLDEMLQALIDQHDPKVQAYSSTQSATLLDPEKIQKLSKAFNSLLESNQVIHASELCHLSLGNHTEKSKHTNVSAPLYNGKKCLVDLNLRPAKEDDRIELEMCITEISNTSNSNHLTNGLSH